MQKNIYPGKFIVFEGLDGSGQTTQASKLADFLDQKKQMEKFGHTGVHITKEPTSYLIGGLIKSQLSHDWKSSPECLQLLFTADRAHHLEKEILPLLERGIIVISDRYFFSTIAFGGLNIDDQDWLIQLNKRFLMPDITFLLKVSPKVCIERINKSRFGVELFEEEEKLKKVWDNYESLTTEFENINIINGEGMIDRISQEITEILTQKLK